MTLGGRVLHGMPLKFRIYLEGEVIGMTEKEVEAMVYSDLSMSCRLGSLTKGMAIQFGTVKLEGVNAPKT